MIRRPRPSAPPGLWDRPDMSEALDNRDMTAILKIYQRWTGASQPQIAAMTGVSQPTISVILNGKRTVTALAMFERFADGLDIPRGRLGLAESGATDVPLLSPEPDRRTVLASGADGDREEAATPRPISNGTMFLGEHRGWTKQDSGDLAEFLTAESEVPVDATAAARLAHEWLIAEPPQVIEVRAGRRIGEELIRKIEGRVAQLRRMDDFIGGKNLSDLVARELRATADLLRGAAYDEQLGQRLLSIIAELCQLSGWVAADAGSNAAAERYLTAGIKAAHAADDEPVAANLISTLSYQKTNRGNPKDAILLARTAYQGARRATATTRALLAERVAWAHANARELAPCEKALGDVERLYGGRSPDDDPIWVYWLDEDEISVMVGRCYVELNKPERAEPFLADAIARYDETHTREVALYRTWLAEAHLQRGDIDEAIAEATRALLLDAQARSARSSDRISNLRSKLRPHRGTGQIREFEERCHSLTDADTTTAP